MRVPALALLLAACGSGPGYHHHQVTSPPRPHPVISGVLAGRSASGAFEVGVYDVELSEEMIPAGTTGTPGTAAGTLYVSDIPVPLMGTYSDQGVLDFEGLGYAFRQMNPFGSFDGPYTGPTAEGWYSAMPVMETRERHCGTVAGDETGVLAFVIASGQVRLDIATADRNDSTAGDIEHGTADTADTVTIDGPEKLHLDGARTEAGGFTGTWRARDRHGTWEASPQACPGPL